MLYITTIRINLDLVRPFEFGLGDDKKPYTTLMYTNGPKTSPVRENLTDVDTSKLLTQPHNKPYLLCFTKGDLNF